MKQINWNGRFRQRMWLRDSGSLHIDRAAPAKELHPAAANRWRRGLGWRKRVNGRINVVRSIGWSWSFFYLWKGEKQFDFGMSKIPVMAIEAYEWEWDDCWVVLGYFLCIFNENKDQVLCWWPEKFSCVQLALSPQIKIFYWFYNRWAFLFLFKDEFQSRSVI